VLPRRRIGDFGHFGGGRRGSRQSALLDRCANGFEIRAVVIELLRFVDCVARGSFLAGFKCSFGADQASFESTLSHASFETLPLLRRNVRRGHTPPRDAKAVL